MVLGLLGMCWFMVWGVLYVFGCTERFIKVKVSNVM